MVGILCVTSTATGKMPNLENSYAFKYKRYKLPAETLQIIL